MVNCLQNNVTVTNEGKYATLIQLAGQAVKVSK